MAREKSFDERFAEIEAALAELRRDVAAAQPARRREVDVAVAAERWVHGLGWDETFDREMVEEEFDRIERRVGSPLPADERERLIQLWLAIRGERSAA
jgi:hypothetical protein